MASSYLPAGETVSSLLWKGARLAVGATVGWFVGYYGVGIYYQAFSDKHKVLRRMSKLECDYWKLKYDLSFHREAFYSEMKKFRENMVVVCPVNELMSAPRRPVDHSNRALKAKLRKAKRQEQQRVRSSVSPLPLSYWNEPTE